MYFRTKLFRSQIQSIRAQFESICTQTAGWFVSFPIYVQSKRQRVALIVA